MQKLDDLNEEQKLAVETLEGPLLVIAGAGSGKTRVVTMRIARLIEMGVPASRIVALTFTNKAAQEMQQRVRTLVGYDVLACTFHSLGVRILREVAEEVGLEPGFTIYDEKDSETLLKGCLETLKIKDEKGFLKAVRSEISQAKNAFISPEEMKNEVYTLYQARLKQYNAVDFDDLLYLTVKFFQNSPKAEEIQKRFSYILVDEYQDTNHAQYLICKYLSSNHHCICAVGDPDQSIYSWRGADVSNILNFEKEFVGARVITLNQNYRSTNAILRGAGGLIDHNQRPYNKNLHSDLGEGEKIGVHYFSSDREEVRFVTEKMVSYARKFPLDQIVIFYRTNFQSRLFEDALLAKQIPYTIVGGLSFYLRKEIKDVLAFLRLAVSGRDFVSFTRTINIFKRGFGPKAIQTVKELAEQTGKGVLEVLPEMKLNATQKKNAAEYVSMIEDIRFFAQGHSTVREVIGYAVERIGYISYLQLDPETAREKKENVEELLSKAGEWAEGKLSHEARLKNFLEELALQTSVQQSREEQTSVKLMTLHNGKGLEFDVCFIVGMEEELFPHTNSQDAIEEERRLCYVGMTRARKHLHLTSTAFRFLWGSARSMRPSRFLQEIPEETTRVFPQEGGFRAPRNENKQDRIVEGKIVSHPVFGKGIIERQYETSLGKTFDVKFFEDGERRSLVEKFAKLTFI